jgi:rhamnosyltransferase subunit B
MAKRIVFAVWGSLGDLHPYLAIALELQARGHSCIIATHYVARPTVEAVGVEFAPMGPHFNPDPKAMKKAMHPRRGPRFLLRDLVFPYTPLAFADTMRAIVGAELLITHPIAYGAQLAAEKSGIRWVSTTLAPIGFMSAHEPSLRRQYPALARLTTLGPMLDRALLRYGRWATASWTGPVRQLRAQLGLPRRASPIFEGQFSPALTLALFSPAFGQSQTDWPPNTFITGFPFYHEPLPPNPDLRKFLQHGEPPVVFTLGSSASLAPGAFFSESLRAIRGLGRRAILIVGTFAPNLVPRSLPPNVAAFPYAPYSELFPHAAVNVHQGGIGTIAEALRAGRPMLVVPFAFDQPDNAARAEELGVARSLPIRRYTAQRAARELECLLHDASYVKNAAGLGERIRAENGVAATCRKLETLLAS